MTTWARPLRSLLVCIVVLAWAAPAAAIDCNLLPPRPPVTLDSVFTFNLGTSGGTDCWGWTGPDGTEYAIMGTSGGITFVNATALQVIATIPGPLSGCGSTRWRDIKNYRNYCYAVSECTGTNQGIMIMDMQWLPDSVHYVGSYLFGTDTRSHNLSIDTATGYLYAIKQNYLGFRVISLANPEAPAEFPYVNTVDLHDVFARNDTVWAAEATQGSWSVWNMANKNSAQLIARVAVPNPGYVHNIWPTADGQYAITTEETANKTMKVWDTQDWQNVQLVAEYIAPSHLAHNVHVLGSHVITSHYESGVHIADISTPECPVTVGSFDTYPNSENSNFNGCWGAYPFTGNGMIYASNLNGRLFILQSSISPVDFSGTPLVGNVPLAVDFTDMSLGGPSAWDWDFGDGGASSAQNPSHLYTEGGLFDVALQVTTAGGSPASMKQNFVTVLAETLSVENVQELPNTAGHFDVDAHNTVPLTEFLLTINLTNVPNVLFFDSMSVAGTRASYFELKEIVFDNRFNGQLAMRFRANNGGGSPPLPPGDGAIARVHFRTRSFAMQGDTSYLSTTTLGSYSLTASTLTAAFTPSFSGATLTVVAPPCDCSEHGDIVDDGLLTAVDLAFFIDFIYFAGAQPPRDPACPHNDRGDYDCDGIDTPADLARLIDAVFFGGAPACDPCACASYPSSCP